MGLTSQPLSIVIDGQTAPLGLDSADPLVRSVFVSLFSWRRAEPDDDLPGNSRMGWWADTFPTVENDQIGSRLWLLSRAKITQLTLQRAKQYAEEALEWMLNDGVASRIEVDVERQGLDRVALGVRVYRGKTAAPTLDLRFSNVWEFLNV